MKNYSVFDHSGFSQKVLIFSIFMMFFCSDITKGNQLSQNKQQGPSVDTVPAKGLIITQISGGEIVSIHDITNEDSKKSPVSAAEFPGGNREWTRYLLRTIRYPYEAMNKNIQGQVVVKFIVDEKGRLRHLEALTGSKELQEEAIRVIRESGRWTPAQENGGPVKSEKEQVITFRLETPSRPPIVAQDSAGTRDVEVESAFPGGVSPWLSYLNRTVRYPEMALKNGIQGTVVVQFIVEKDGRVSGIEAVSGPNEGGLREEAIRVIKKSGKWVPGTQNGLPVKTYKKQPITFSCFRD